MTSEGHATRRQWLYLAATLGLIAVGTFPWDLQNHPHPYKVAWAPFVTGVVRPQDLLLNALLYFPVGYFLPLQSRRTRVLWTAGLALLVSGLLEYCQVWSHSRFPSSTDLVMNVAGSIAGALAGTRHGPRA